MATIFRLHAPSRVVITNGAGDPMVIVRRNGPAVVRCHSLGHVTAGSYPIVGDCPLAIKGRVRVLVTPRGATITQGGALVMRIHRSGSTVTPGPACELLGPP